MDTENGCICGNCKYHKHDDTNGDWVCTNPDSEYIADFTDYSHWCSDFEERE